MNDHESGGKTPTQKPKTIEQLLGQEPTANEVSTPAGIGSPSKMKSIAQFQSGVGLDKLLKIVGKSPDSWSPNERMLAERFAALRKGGAAGPMTAGGFDAFSQADTAKEATRTTQSPESAAGSLHTGGGQLLPQNIRQAVESMTGVSLDNVRIRTDQPDVVSAMGAEAAAVGNTLHFAEGMYNPNTADGQRLIAEEALHAAQGKLGLLPQTTGVSNTSMDAEVQAKQASLEVTRGLGVRGQSGLDTSQQTQLDHLTQGLTNEMASDPFGGGFDAMFDSFLDNSSYGAIDSMMVGDASAAPAMSQTMPEGLAPDGGEVAGENAAPVMLSEDPSVCTPTDRDGDGREDLDWKNPNWPSVWDYGAAVGLVPQEFADNPASVSLATMPGKINALTSGLTAAASLGSCEDPEWNSKVAAIGSTALDLTTGLSPTKAGIGQTGKGATVASGSRGTWTGLEATERALELAKQLPKPGSTVPIPRGSVTLDDLATLASSEAAEFAVVKIGGKRHLIRGTSTTTTIPEGAELIMHVHPGEGFMGLRPSAEDMEALGLLGQERSALLNESGAWRTFGREGPGNNIYNYGGN